MCHWAGHGVGSGSNGGWSWRHIDAVCGGDQAVVMGIVTDMLQSDCTFCHVMV
jgi:hypothetical protein